MTSKGSHQINTYWNWFLMCKHKKWLRNNFKYQHGKMLVWSWHSGAMRFSTNFQLWFAFSLAMISRGYNILKIWSLYPLAIFVGVPFFSFLVGMPGLLFFFSFSLSFFHFDRQCLATIFSQVATNKIRKRQGAYIQRIRYGSGEKGLSTVRLTNRL